MLKHFVIYNHYFFLSNKKVNENVCLDHNSFVMNRYMIDIMTDIVVIKIIKLLSALLK